MSTKFFLFVQIALITLMLFGSAVCFFIGQYSVAANCLVQTMLVVVVSCLAHRYIVRELAINPNRNY